MQIAHYKVGEKKPLLIISGPCVIESEEHALACAMRLKEICKDTPLIYKSSFDKANRTSLSSYRGPGLEKGLEILAAVKEKTGLPVTTDIHLPEQAAIAAEVCDILQIPAFLCRQTDLLVAAAKTGKPVNVKKGQFLAPWDMQYVVDKLVGAGCKDLMLTDRGAMFGYNNLVSDMRAIPLMQNLGHPVCFDASHSAQLPGGLGEKTGGMRELIPTLAKSAIAAGANALFIETHDNPEKALCDGSTVFPLDEFPALLDHLLRLHALTHSL
jgi:2-dehydro-3-deoxyphosphooctonate aldolase (KDO 8-P synthase)